MSKHSVPLLDEVYEKLDYQSGDLFDVGINRSSVGIENYISKGQWLDTCFSINSRNQFHIDKIFFVQDNPIIVFVDANTIEQEKIFNVYNEVWSLARPRLVFVQNDSAITVYDLASNPARSNEDLTPLSKTINEAKQILKELKRYRRESIESGTVFGDEHFDSVNKRADLSLINDLKQARSRLFDHGLNGENLKYAHALIGRSIFIRYLEDRGVLTKEYFTKVAKGNKKWLNIIETPIEATFYRIDMKSLIFPRILADRDLTFHLFKKIAEDFNGDTFNTDETEEQIVNQTHLNLLQNFLIGEGKDAQLPLFLWAYRFDVIPIDLISSIYEEFYHSENLIDSKTQKLKDGKGTHYTPSSLVEFVLAQTLTLDVLKKRPRVLDPACGSGIFLVESFRRMVRYELFVKNKKVLDLEELLHILKTQIAGIEINSEAVKIAAFSLYLSLLHYLNPPSILSYVKKGGKLPYLIWHGQKKENHFNILLESNSFDEDKTELVFQRNSFDLVVGNPPWGSPGTGDLQGREALKSIEEWCKVKGIEFPDKEPSHAFLFRAIDYLKPGGLSSLLVSSGVLLKFSRISNNYKQQLLSQSTLKSVVNFSHVRRVFFSGAISPFVLIRLEKKAPHSGSLIDYLSLKKSGIIEKNKIVLIDKNDFKKIKYEHTKVNDIWKIFYWGNEHDFNLISSIRRFELLKEYCDLENCAQGFQEANKSKNSNWLLDYKEIPIKYFQNKYGSFDLSNREDLLKLSSIPPKVKVRGKAAMYDGQRILIKRGVAQKNTSPKGQVIARIESDRFAFRHSIICIKLNSKSTIDYETTIGIMWSSLFRYYMFMTASTWGTWREEIHLNEVLDFPIANPSKSEATQIGKIVKGLQEEHRNDDQFFTLKDETKLRLLEEELDNKVFDLYQLTPFERTLIRNRCNYDIDYYYRGTKSLANEPIRKESELDSYIASFRSHWSLTLEPHEYFDSRIMMSADKSMLGVVFMLRSSKAEITINYKDDPNIDDFESLLSNKVSRDVYTEGLFRRVSDDQIIIIKYNKKGNWTETEAKTDAEATLLHALTEH